MDVEPRQGLVFCHFCNMWGIEDQFSITNRVIGGVIRQLLYHTTVDYFGSAPMEHIANWRREVNGLELR